MNYRNLKGLESEDLWGNRTKVTNVEDDIIWISTYRKHPHPHIHIYPSFSFHNYLSYTHS